MTGLSEATGEREGKGGMERGRRRERWRRRRCCKTRGDELKQTSSFVEVSVRVDKKKKDRKGRRTGEEFVIESERRWQGLAARAGGPGAAGRTETSWIQRL